MSRTTRPNWRASQDDLGWDEGEDSDVLREALDLVELGLPVIPLNPRSKKPRIEQWQTRASCDPRTIRRWFQGRPDDNLGLRTGEGLVALDVDAGSGGFNPTPGLRTNGANCPRPSVPRPAPAACTCCSDSRSPSGIGLAFFPDSTSGATVARSSSPRACIR